jgi:6-phosphogluconate dehydrogenase
MVHNGIEYADMQLITEAYDLFKTVYRLDAAAIAKIFEQWKTGDLDSYLIEITAAVLNKRDEKTGGALVDAILDEAEQKGTGRWTARNALDLGVPLTGITEAVYARVLSAQRALRAEAEKRLPDKQAPGGKPEQADIDAIREALYASKIVAYAQGFEQMTAASKEYGWDLRLGEVANYFSDAVLRAEASWRRVVALAVEHGVAIPAFSSSLSYYDGLRRSRGPANLLQGLRDYFGAHTYRRLDAEGSFHTRWGQDGKEIAVL